MHPAVFTKFEYCFSYHIKKSDIPIHQNDDDETTTFYICR